MSKDKKNKTSNDQENFILKKIRHYQGSIKDYETFWNDKISEGEREESPETKKLIKVNADLNKSFEIIPIDKCECSSKTETSDTNDCDKKEEKVCKKCKKKECECDDEKKVEKKRKVEDKKED